MLYWGRKNDPDVKTILNHVENLDNIFETRIKASEVTICSKVDALECKLVEYAEKTDANTEWRRSIYKNIAVFTVKYGLMSVAIAVVIMLIIGIQNGIVTKVFAQILG